jgi:hypothetical protein
VPCAVCRVLALNHHDLRRPGCRGLAMKCALDDRQAAARYLDKNQSAQSGENILAKDALREASRYVVDFIDKVMDNGLNTLIN